MVFSRFRRPYASLRVETKENVLRPGGELEIDISLAPKEGFRVRRGMVELICTEAYLAYNNQRAGYYKVTRTPSRVSRTFMEDAVVREGAPYSTRTSLVAPQDALPTASGAPHNSVQPGISWELMTWLDLANRRDIRQSERIRVVRPRLIESGRGHSIVTESKQRQCVLTLTLPSLVAHSREIIEGRLRAEVLQDMNLSEIRVELVRVEKFGAAEKDFTVDKATLGQDMSLRRSRAREWQFGLNIGHVSAPSLNAENSSVRWFVRGVLSRRMRSDPRVEQEIRVDI